MKKAEPPPAQPPPATGDDVSRIFLDRLKPSLSFVVLANGYGLRAGHLPLEPCKTVENPGIELTPRNNPGNSRNEKISMVENTLRYVTFSIFSNHGENVYEFKGI